MLHVEVMDNDEHVQLHSWPGGIFTGIYIGLPMSPLSSSSVPRVSRRFSSLGSRILNITCSSSVLESFHLAASRTGRRYVPQDIAAITKKTAWKDHELGQKQLQGISFFCLSGVFAISSHPPSVLSKPYNSSDLGSPTLKIMTLLSVDRPRNTMSGRRYLKKAVITAATLSMLTSGKQPTQSLG